MSATDLRPDPNEQAVTQPELLEFVERARAMRVPTVRVDTPTLLEAVAHHRAARIRWLAAGTLIGMAAAWLLWVTIDRRAWVEATEATHDEAPRVLEGSRDSGEAREEVRRDEPAQAIVVDALPAVEPSAPPVIDASPPAAEATDEVAAPVVLAKEDAATLAQRAELAMAAKRRDEAITLLTTLVRKFPKAAEAKAALLDLGRLLRDDGRPDHARCAYQLLVDRWPSEAKAPEITRVLASLGDGPKCRGLKPQR